MSSQFFENSIFWIEIEKVKPNPYQPRRDFDEARLKDLSESIRMYGVLQPLVVTRKEYTKEDGGIGVEYELIAGERRLRASKLAGLTQVPALIRNGEESDKMKLELAIIENLQREDINSVDRARAFDRLAKEFGMKHIQIAEKVGKSREYVSNTMRILMLPELILNGLSEGKLSEGHTRPLLMLVDKPEEQLTLFKEIVFKKLTVREAEAYARKIAQDKVRKKSLIDPELIEMENKLQESLGTRVSIEKRENGGRITIDYFTAQDIHNFLEKISAQGVEAAKNAVIPTRTISDIGANQISNATPLQVSNEVPAVQTPEVVIPQVESIQSQSVVDSPSIATGVEVPQISEVQPIESVNVAVDNVVSPDVQSNQVTDIVSETSIELTPFEASLNEVVPETVDLPVDDRAPEDIKVSAEESEEDLYSLKNFGV